MFAYIADLPFTWILCEFSSGILLLTSMSIYITVCVCVHYKNVYKHPQDIFGTSSALHIFIYNVVLYVLLAQFFYFSVFLFLLFFFLQQEFILLSYVCIIILCLRDTTHWIQQHLFLHSTHQNEEYRSCGTYPNFIIQIQVYYICIYLVYKMLLKPPAKCTRYTFCFVMEFVLSLYCCFCI